ncbi:hypothetical protein ACI3KS_15340 [Microbacterium sp. ZW T5_45]|uniref:hypothetical protein n=1 Tax=Microbacterium sp. ZW T5_45 TaxID=3378080 RepID=UPI0038525B8D
MSSFMTTGTGSFDEMWARFHAQQALAGAIDSLDAAGAALVSLTADTQWSADGVRALNQKLGDAQSAAGAEAALLRTRSWELDQAAAS